MIKLFHGLFSPSTKHVRFKVNGVAYQLHSDKTVVKEGPRNERTILSQNEAVDLLLTNPEFNKEFSKARRLLQELTK